MHRPKAHNAPQPKTPVPHQIEIKEFLKQRLRETLQSLVDAGELPRDMILPELQIERSRNPRRGDFSSNVALLLVKQAACPPLELAGRIARGFAKAPGLQAVERVEAAAPGFVNFFLSPQTNLAAVLEILRKGQHYGEAALGAGQSILLEFVSANPTGPLHIGHGRGAAFGAALAKLLRKAGYRVECEYYVNDAGRQMDILAVSVWLRYLALLGAEHDLPAQTYQGEYVTDIARTLHEQHGKKFALAEATMPSRDAEAEAEARLDTVIDFARRQLGNEHYQLILDTALTQILDGIKADLRRFGIEYQNWFSERSLLDGETLQTCIAQLTRNGHCYTRNGATWFNAKKFGDEKDRVLIRNNGQPTYFATDLAYHVNKFERGYDRLINVWGADHHGYVQRLKAALRALGKQDENLDILLVQFAKLYRGKQRLPMSTRSGNYVTLGSLCAEISVDAARIFYNMRKTEQHLDFDLELAKSHSNENPVYYIQYAHARICSVFKKLKKAKLRHQPADLMEALLPLTEPEERRLVARLAEYPDVIMSAAQQYEPHQLLYYLRELANDFHSYYNSHQFQVQEARLRNARLSLILACKMLFSDGLALLGAQTPEEM